VEHLSRTCKILGSIPSIGVKGEAIGTNFMCSQWPKMEKLELQK
jgi:hypothetical protein